MMNERNAHFFSSNVVPFPKRELLPVAKMSNERLEALGELYLRLKIGERHRLDFDSYVWAVHTGRWYEFVEDHFPKVHAVYFTYQQPNDNSAWIWLLGSLIFMCIAGGMFK